MFFIIKIFEQVENSIKYDEERTVKYKTTQLKVREMKTVLPLVKLFWNKKEIRLFK